MNVLDYLKWRGDIPFYVSAFNDIDNIILTEFPYLNWAGIITDKPITLEEAIAQYKPVTFESTLKTRRQETVMMACRSERFKHVKAFRYVKDFSEEQEKQFCAMSFKLPDRTYYISYCGTDSTITGWKENFNMTYMMPVPAQQEAVRYLKKAVSGKLGKFRVGGHSKGGNLAFYAAVNLGKPEKIIQVYNNDGPGFDREFIESEAYQAMKPKLKTFLPESSIVGRLLNDGGNIIIVKSLTYDIFWQHSPQMWDVDVTNLTEVRDPTLRSDMFSGLMDDWNDGLSKQDKIFFIDTFFDTLAEMNIKTTDEFLKHPARVISRVLAKVQEMDSDKKKIMADVMNALLKSFKKNYLGRLLGGKSDENTGVE